MDSIAKPALLGASICCSLATLWRLEKFFYNYNISQLLRQENRPGLARAAVGAHLLITGKAVRQKKEEALAVAQNSDQKCLYYETTLLRIIDVITRSKQSGSYSRNKSHPSAKSGLYDLAQLRPSRGKHLCG